MFFHHKNNNNLDYYLKNVQVDKKNHKYKNLL